jgi:cytochrome c peroxidase
LIFSTSLKLGRVLVEVTAMMALFLIALISIPLGLDLYLPMPATNVLTQGKVELGRQLFFDRRLSRDGTISCATCHNPNRAFSTPATVATGVGSRRGRRNPPALINRGYGQTFFWDGRAATLEDQVIQPIQDTNEMNLSLEEATARVKLEPTELSRALASYVRSILSGNSPYDRFATGDRSALTKEQQLGLQLFRGKGNCSACHVGPNFTDEQFHNTGVTWHDGQLADEGRFEVTANPQDRGAFKTPTLREITRTGPYMHDGSMATLEQVIAFYSDGGRANPFLDSEIRPRSFTPEEQRALLAFLASLTGEVRQGWR